LGPGSGQGGTSNGSGGGGAGHGGPGGSGGGLPTGGGGGATYDIATDPANPGSGGGGGFGPGGGAGGGGGAMLKVVASGNAVLNGSIQVSGAPGNGATVSNSGSGGGGSGGTINIHAQNISGSGNLSANGGNGGGSGLAGSGGGGGGAGGRINLCAVSSYMYAGLASEGPGPSGSGTTSGAATAGLPGSFNTCGFTPTSTPTPSGTFTVTLTVSPTFTSTVTLTPTPTVTRSFTPSASPSATGTATPTASPSATVTISPSPTASPAPVNYSAWQYYRTVTITNTGGPALTNWPVLVQCGLDTAFFAAARADGADIRFSDPSGTYPYDFELAKWVPGSQVIQAWVKVPSIPAGGTAQFRVYYGNPAAAAGLSNPVWPPEAVGVWHLEQGSGTTALDSSRYSNNGTLMLSPTWNTAGKVNTALTFSGSNRVEVPASASINSALGAFTLMAWNRPTATGTMYYLGRNPGSISYALLLGSNNPVINVNGSVYNYGASNGVGTWYQMGGTYDGSTATQFRNGSILNSGAASVPSSSAAPFVIGALDTSNSFAFQGDLDEVRLYNRAFSAGEMLAEYNNQSCTWSAVGAAVAQFTFTPTPTASPTVTPTPSQTPSASPSASPSITPTVTPTRTPTPTATPSPANTSTAQPTLTNTAIPGPGTAVGGPAVSDSVLAIARFNNTIYVGGNFDPVGGRNAHGVILNGSTGAVQPNAPSFAGRVLAVVPDGAGGWYAGGDFSYVAGQKHVSLVHVLSNMAVDPAFNPGVNSTVLALALSGNTLYLGGHFTTLNSGTLTRNFLAAVDATTGAVLPFNSGVGPDWDVDCLALNGSTLYFGGAFTNVNGVSRAYAAAMDTTGAGSLLPWAPQMDNNVYTLAVGSGAVYAGGIFANVNGTVSQPYLAGFDPSSGALQTGFNPQSDGEVDTLLYSGGRLFVGGGFTHLQGLLRNNLASVDPSTGAPSTWDPSPGGSLNAMALSGSTLYFASWWNGGLNAVDINSGLSTGWAPPANRDVESIAVQGGLVFAGGSFTAVNSLVSTGGLMALDANNGTLQAFSPLPDGGVVALDTDSAGNILVGGNFGNIASSAMPKIARLKPDGTRDGSFNVGTGADGTVEAVRWDPATGKIYIGGSFTHYNGTVANGLARLNSDGSLDPSFNTGTGLTGGTHEVFDIELQAPGGPIYIGGDFTQYNGAGGWNLARLNPDGSLDTTFNVGTGFDNSVLAMQYDPAGARLYVGGFFGSYKGSPSSYLLRLDNSGTLDAGFSGMADYFVQSLLLDRGILFAGGSFSTFGGTTRYGLAAYNIASSSLLSWAPGCDGDIYALRTNAAGNRIFIGNDNLSWEVGQEPAGHIAQVLLPALPTVTPSPSYSPTGSPTASATPSASPTATPSTTPSSSPTATPSQTPSSTPSVTPSASPSATPTSTLTASPTPTATVTATQTATPTQTQSITPSVTPTATPSQTQSVTPSATPTVTQTQTQSVTPSITPTATPSQSPSNSPSATPTDTPSVSPSITPTASPSSSSTVTESATPSPVGSSTDSPTMTPSATATVTPTASPTPPVISSLNPNSGLSSGGDTVAINGAFFSLSATVRFGATAVTVISGTASVLYVISPPGTGNVDVVVTNPGGVSSAPVPFSYSPPLIASLNPSSGPLAGGNTVTINGSYFSTSATVSFGANSATVISATASAISVVAPAGLSGPANVVVTNPGGAVSGAAVYTYVPPTFTPSATPSSTPTTSPTLTETGTVTPTATPTATPSISPTFSQTGTVTPTVSPSDTPSVTLTGSPTPPNTSTVTPTVTPTSSPTLSPLPSASSTGTATATASPTPANTATASPLPSATASPVVTATISPTFTPLGSATNSPLPTNTPQIPAVLSQNLWHPGTGQPLHIGIKAPYDGHVTVHVYNTAAELVRTPFEADVPAGQSLDAIWDGRNEDGQSCGAGVYIVAVHGAGISSILKVVLMK
jgi:uncharacterized delta-60 repeat protein